MKYIEWIKAIFAAIVVWGVIIYVFLNIVSCIGNML